MRTDVDYVMDLKYELCSSQIILLYGLPATFRKAYIYYLSLPI